VNGKVRGRIEVPRDASEESIISAALADAAVKAHIDGKQIRRRVVVPGRLVNLVV
jgi:leucyl-tRNA synthetase